MSLFVQGTAGHVVVAAVPKLRTAMHLDTVFTFAGRDVAPIRGSWRRPTPSPSAPGDVSPGAEAADEGPRTFSDVMARSLGPPVPRVVETGGDVYASGHRPWGSGDNAVALVPGVVFTYDRGARANELLRGAEPR